jgi:hypothetical protein
MVNDVGAFNGGRLHVRAEDLKVLFGVRVA